MRGHTPTSANAEKCRRYRAKYPEKAYARRAKWYADHPGKSTEYTSRYRELHPDRAAAHIAVTNAIAAGSLTRGPCSECGEPSGVHGHHDDYSRPLDVRWLCRSCHDDVHRRES